MSSAKTSERRRPYPAGEIVFAKLKGYPWWPAKIEDESNVPEAVLEAKRKKKTATNAYIVFFFGSLDYAFFSEKMLRPFNHDIVQQDIKTAKFKNKELVEALFQALEPASLNSLQTPTQQQEHGHESSSRDIDQQKSKYINTSTPSLSPAKRKNTATITKHVPEAIKRRSVESKPHINQSYGSGDPPLSPGCSKKRQNPSPTDSPIPSRTEYPKSQSSPRKPKYTKSAAEKSPQYARIYGYPYSLQKLIYGKKPGEIPTDDYSKISDILQEVEQCDMTKELLKATKIGKVVQFGCRYVFGNDHHYRLQKRCVEIMENWKTALLDQHNPLSAHHTATTSLTKQPKGALTNDSSACGPKNKHRLEATPTSPKVGTLIQFATESYITGNDCTSASIMTFESKIHHVSTRKGTTARIET